MIHAAASGGWTRHYAYNENSLIQPSKNNNRLSSTSLPGDNPLGSYSSQYGYLDEEDQDVHGCITSMPHLTLMQWDFKDQLQATSKQSVTSGIPETTWYVYDASGQRIRKVTDNSADPSDDPKIKNERIYLGGFEIYREYETDGGKKLERETLHVMDDKQRIALVETKTVDNSTITTDHAPLNIPLIRYQLNNHLGSSSLELDPNAIVISHEEFYPYGNTSFQAMNADIRSAAKRYRYTGKERDDENGLYYHGARYYAACLGRWCSTDPMGFVDGLNLYKYAKNSPVLYSDPNGFSSATNEEGHEVIGDPNAYTGCPPLPDPEDYNLNDVHEKALYDSMIQWWMEEVTINHNEKMSESGQQVTAFWAAWAVTAVGIAAAKAYGFVATVIFLFKEAVEYVVEEVSGIPIINVPEDVA
jgi:RHS repeat-associated protein